MLQGMSFDFDGTLMDSMFIWETAGEVYLLSIGKRTAGRSAKGSETNESASVCCVHPEAI